MATTEQSLTQFWKVSVFPASHALHSLGPDARPSAWGVEPWSYSRSILQGVVSPAFDPGPIALVSRSTWHRSGLGTQSCPCVTCGWEGLPSWAQPCLDWMCIVPYGAITAPWVCHVFNSLSKATSISFWAKTDKSR